MIAEPATSSTPGSEQAALPTHVAIIMDGNGRWAHERGLSRQAGHRAGTENVRRVIETFGERGIQYLTFFAFSTENWVRPRAEVNALMRLVGRVVDREIQTLHEKGVRLLHLGRLDRLSPEVRKKVEQAIDLTKENQRMTVCVAFDYGGRAEIVDAVRRIVADGVPPERVDEALFGSYLYTAGIPDPDLVVRTAGEVRVSNFLLWQSAYAEYYATPTYWPDFGPEEIERALRAYGERVRRFGGVPEEERDPRRPRGRRSGA